MRGDGSFLQLGRGNFKARAQDAQAAQGSGEGRSVVRDGDLPYIYLDVIAVVAVNGFLRPGACGDDCQENGDANNSYDRVGTPMTHDGFLLRPALAGEIAVFMLGCVGVAPPGKMAFGSGFLGSFGGNMDYNRIREGITLYLPVYHSGALLFMGDGHAAQGDGELTGNALETSMDIEFTVDVITRRSWDMPRAEDADYLMAMGIAGSLNEAFQIATTQMAQWIEETYKLNPAEASSVLGTAMTYDIAEVVDPYVNVVARVSKQALAQIAK